MKGWSSLHKEQSNVWLSVQRNEWQRVGTARGCAGGGKQWCVGVISTKSVPYDTHSHGLCLDSLSLSLWNCLPTSYSLFLCSLMKEQRRRWGRRARGGGGYFSATTGALWWQGPGHVTHQGLCLSHGESSIKQPSSSPPCLPLSLSSNQTTTLTIFICSVQALLNDPSGSGTGLWPTGHSAVESPFEHEVHL